MTRRDRAPRLVVVAAMAAVVTAILGGCSNIEDPEVPVVPTPEESATTADTEKVGTTPSPTSTTGVPELCGELATAGEVAQILKVPMRGETVRVYNDDFLKQSGRTGRLDCTYGTPEVPPGRKPPKKQQPPLLKISVAGYIDAETAADQLSSTVDAALADGDRVEALKIAGRDGFVVTDADDNWYVVADDVRTYVITIPRGVVPRTAVKVVLAELARHLLGASTSTPGVN